MRNLAVLSCCILFAAGCVARAEHIEVGVGAGGSLYRNQTLTNGAQSASAGLDRGFAAGVWLGQDMYRYVGGEVRYMYERNDLSLSASGAKAGFRGDAHVVHYDILVHFAPRESRVRPFIFGGGGVKLYRGLGTESATQPLSRVALLTNGKDTKAVVSFGAGLKIHWTSRLYMRLEFRDYLSAFPDKVLTPNAGTSGKGWLHNFVPGVGLGYTF